MLSNVILKSTTLFKSHWIETLPQTVDLVWINSKYQPITYFDVRYQNEQMIKRTGLQSQLRTFWHTQGARRNKKLPYNYPFGRLMNVFNCGLILLPRENSTVTIDTQLQKVTSLLGIDRTFNRIYLTLSIGKMKKQDTTVKFYPQQYYHDFV